MILHVINAKQDTDPIQEFAIHALTLAATIAHMIIIIAILASMDIHKMEMEAALMIPQDVMTHIALLVLLITNVQTVKVDTL